MKKFNIYICKNEVRVLEDKASPNKVKSFKDLPAADAYVDTFRSQGNVSVSYKRSND